MAANVPVTASQTEIMNGVSAVPVMIMAPPVPTKKSPIMPVALHRSPSQPASGAAKPNKMPPATINTTVWLVGHPQAFLQR